LVAAQLFKSFLGAVGRPGALPLAAAVAKNLSLRQNLAAFRSSVRLISGDLSFGQPAA
jgi:hypothetical protein